MNINQPGKLKCRNNGFTLIELIISIVIAVIILAAVLTMFVSMVKSNTDNMKSIRLNQDLRATMSLITRNLRRAGANLASETYAGPPLIPNPFQVEPSEDVDGDVIPDDFDCILFTYDEANDGVLDSPAELFGYRWDRTEETVEVRQNGNSCTDTNWENVTDENLILIKDLSFIDTIDAPGLPGIPSVRRITISITGELTNDSDVSRTIEETINVRNN